jgi:prepilin-type processing-associated H-X9-DG protein
VDISRESLQINAPGRQPGTSAGIGSSYHDGGTQIALADGSVRFLSEKISPDALQKLTTAAGGESMVNVEF